MNIRTLQIADIELPADVERLRDLAYDLWWSWSPAATRLFAWIDPEHWRRYHNPVQLLINVEPAHWMRLLSDPEFRRAYDLVIQDLDAYRTRPRWSEQASLALPGAVAYFSMEFGIHESLGTYSGGLGVLSGDHCKAASDLGVPLVGVGLHRPNVRGNLLGIIARARAIRTGYEDHQPSAWVHGRASCTKCVVHPTPYRNSSARLAPCARSH